MNDIVERLCHLFEQMAEDEQAQYWQPLIHPLTWHAVNVISQRRYFTGDELLNLEAWAKDIANFAILPSVKEVEFDVLLEQTAFRGLVLMLFHEGQKEKVYCLNNALIIIPSRWNVPSFITSLTYLQEQERIFVQGIKEVVKRIRNNPAAYLALGATETGEVTFTQELQNELADQTSWMSLPEHKRLDKIGDSVQDWLFKLMEMPVMTRYKNSFLTALDAERDLMDEHRRLTETKKGRVEAETTSLDEEEETKDGDTIPILELISAPPNTPQGEIEFTELEKEEVREFLNETEVRILEAIFHDPYATQEEIAQQAGCTQSKVSKAIREKVNPNKQRIKEILGIC